MERSGLRFENFCLEMVKNRRAKKKFFFDDFTLQNMAETTLPDGLETSGQRAHRLFWHIFRDLESLGKSNGKKWSQI